MKTTKANFLISILLLFPLFLCAQIDPGIPFDLQAFIDGEVNAGNTTIVIPPGRHRVSPNVGNSNYHIRLDDLNDITIIGDNVEIIFTETVQGIYISNCNNLKITGLSLDYDPLPFTQGEIVGISADNTTLTVDVIDGYSTTVIGNKLEIYDALIEELAVNTYYGITYSIDEINSQIVITKPTASFDNLLKLGDIAVLNSQNTTNIPHSILARESTNLIFESITIFSSTSFSFFETYSNGSSYINCSVDRRPIENEVVPRGLKRMRSGNADAFHSKHSETGPSYVGCIARYNGDDSYAINGDFHFISETNDAILTVIAKGGGNNVPNLQVGETVELVAYSGERIPDAVITQIVAGGPLNATEINFLQNYSGFNGEAAQTYTASNVYFITIDRTVDLPLGSLINSANRVGNGFEIRDCISGPNRSRGALVKASNGIITGNTFVGNWMQSIICAPEYRWFEAANSSNVEISNNEIIGCRRTAIRVGALGGDGSVPQAGAHNNIRVFNNQITNHLGPNDEIFKITSTRNLCFYENTHDIGDPQVYLENVEFTPDTDNDGILDCADLDNDNDGLLDYVENGNLDLSNNASAIPKDSDLDGVPDFLDLDSDNDGIPDNIEAQTTAGYIAPTTTDSVFVDADNDGLNDNYDANTSNKTITESIGLLPIDTDSDTIADYLDLDSDDDSQFDIQENGLADNDSDNNGQTNNLVGINGLDNDLALESTDDYLDVNGLSYESGVFYIADSDNDTDDNGANAIALLTDLDYRDLNTLEVTDPIIAVSTITVFMDETDSYLVFSMTQPLVIEAVVLYDILGKEIKSWDNPQQNTGVSNNLRLKVSDYPSGVYILRAKTEIGVIIKKIYKY